MGRPRLARRTSGLQPNAFLLKLTTRVAYTHIYWEVRGGCQPVSDFFCKNQFTKIKYISIEIIRIKGIPIIVSCGNRETLSVVCRVLKAK